jgi:hypothetical protein
VGESLYTIVDQVTHKVREVESDYSQAQETLRSLDRNAGFDEDEEGYYG